MNAEIIAIGSELLTPYRQDTNSLYLTDKLNQMGVEVSFKTIVGDSLENLMQAATVAFSRADVIIFMGGLGPTEDDLTREAVAAALGLPLRRDPAIVAGLEQRFAAHGWKMAANNLKQADVIAGATSFPTPTARLRACGSAASMMDARRSRCCCPGPPHELKALFEEQCVARLRAKLPEQFIVTRELKITGMGESQCDARVAPIYKPFTDVQTTILAGAGEIQLHLKTRALTLEKAQKRVDELVELIEDGTWRFCVLRQWRFDGANCRVLLANAQATLAVAESCTGGIDWRARHFDQRQFAILSRRRGGVLESR